MKISPLLMASALVMGSSAVLFGSSALAAKKASSSFLCVAKLQCPDSNDSALQELPADEDTAVKAESPAEARQDCLKAYPKPYQSLQKRAPVGCQIHSEALSARGGE